MFLFVFFSVLLHLQLYPIIDPNITMQHSATVIQRNGLNQLTTAHLRWKV